LLDTVIGVNVTHVPLLQRRTGNAGSAGGRIDYQYPTGAVAVPQIAANTVKALAVLSKKPASILPSVPSAHERDLADFDIPTSYAIFLPKGTAKPIVQKLHDAATATMDQPEIRGRLREIGAEVIAPERRIIGQDSSQAKSKNGQRLSRQAASRPNEPYWALTTSIRGLAPSSFSPTRERAGKTYT
jgi:hypothetical protein